MSNDAPAGPFDTLEATFRLGCQDPRPWSLDGRPVAGLPNRDIPLDELRAILLHPSTSYHTRGQALSILVAAAREQGGAATVGLAGVLLFGLRRAVAPLCDVRPDRAADIQAEALVGLMEGIAVTEPDRPRLAARLCWLARNRAKRLFEAEMADLSRCDPYPDAEAPPLPFSHPDLVLAQATAEGIIHPDDAALIGDTRLGVMSLEEAAAALGIGYAAARKRRARAERALAEWLSSEGYRRNVFVPKPARIPYLAGGGRPRGGREPDRRSKTCP
jgi:DNA-directed RNA polymerase specialized sigma24 family protein